MAPQRVRTIVFAVPQRRPRDVVAQVPVRLPPRRAAPKLAALAPPPATVPFVARPAPAADEPVAIPIPDIPAIPDIRAVSDTAVVPPPVRVDAQLVTAPDWHYGAVALGAVVDASAEPAVSASSSPAESPTQVAATPAVVAASVVQTPLPQVQVAVAEVPARVAAASTWDAGTAFPPFDVIGALLMSTPNRPTLAGAKSSATPPL